jgi:hypothetical protein
VCHLKTGMGSETAESAYANLDSVHRHLIKFNPHITLDVKFLSMSHFVNKTIRAH